MIEHRNVTVSKRLIVLNSASSVVARLVNMTVILWMYQYLLKRIPAEEFAVYPVVTAIMVFAPLFFSLFSGGIARYVIEAFAKGEFSQVTRIVSSIAPMITAAAMLFLTVGLAFAFNIEMILNIAPTMVEEARIMMGLLVANFALQMLGLPFSVGFHVRQRYVELNILGVLRDFLRTALLFLFLLGIGPEVVWVVVATVIAELTHLTVVVLRSRQMLPGLSVRLELFSWREARALMSFGLWTTLGQLGTILYINAATIVLNLYGTAVDVTSYHLGATFYRQILSTIQLASLPLQPALTAMHALDDHQRLSRTVLRGGRYALWVSLAVATPLVIYADDFIGLYLGDRYPSAATVIILFMIIFPFTQPNALLVKAAMATARVREMFLPAFLSQLLGFFLMLYLSAYRDFGAVGVAAALSFVSVGSQLVYFWPLLIKRTEISFSRFLSALIVPGYLPAIVGGLVWLGAKILLPPSTWTLLLLDGAIGGFAYVLTLLVLLLRSDERKNLEALLRRLRPPYRART